MNRKYIILIIIGIAIIAALSILIGINMGKTPGTNEPSPSPTQASEFAEVSSETVVPVPEEKYTITLKGNLLALYKGKDKINETIIAPHVLPHSDIEALKSGLSYSTLENALMDWESLCK